MDYKKFLVFVVILIAALSIGMTAYYFLRDNEVIIIKNVEVYTNLGDEPFEIQIERREPKKQTQFSFDVADTNIVKQEQDGSFRAVGAGTTEITLITNKQRVETQKCIVYVGAGSGDNPYFIKDASDLLNIGKDGGTATDKSYKLIADIDLSSVIDFAPIAISGFTGIFDGNGHRITGLNLSGTFENAGLFARIGDNGVVKNLTISNFEISGTIENGGIVAGLNNGIIECVKVENSTLASSKTNANLGGIVGKNTTLNEKAKIDRTASEVQIASYAKAYIGGIAGENFNGKVVNSYYQGFLTSENSSSLRAGLVAKNIGSGSADFSAVQKCYAVANFGDSASNSYGLVASNSYGGKVNYLLGLYYDSTIAPSATLNPTGQGKTESDVLSGKSTTELGNQETYIYFTDSEGTHTWNFDIIWTFKENDIYPTLLMQGNESDISPAVDPGTIMTAQELANIANDLNGTYKLGADIELGANWTPIGTKENPFTGTLDGNGKTISGLTVSGLRTYSGLFGYNKGTLKDIKISGVNITDGTSRIGAVAAINEGTIENAEVLSSAGNNKIEISASGGVMVGAIVGENKGTINGANTDINVSIDSTTGSTNYLGGIAGLNSGFIYNANSSSYVNAKEVSSARVGGISGENSRNIENCKFKGTIKASQTKEGVYVGGVAGYNVSGANIILSGVKSSISGYNAGGLVGFNNFGQVQKSYVLDGTSIQGVKAGGLISSLQRGNVSDCYTLARLRGSSDNSVKAGFAVYVQGSTDLQGNGECAEINNSFSACSFDNVGKNYTESYSNIRVSLAGTNSNKEAGYINNSVYDSTLASNATKAYASGNFWWGSSQDDGGRSTDSCKKIGTFTERGFNTNTWSLIDGVYPTLSGVNLNYFNN